MLDDSDAPFYRWFGGGKLNTCENAVDRHVANGFGEQIAILYDSPMTNSQRAISYANCKMKPHKSLAHWQKVASNMVIA